MNSHAPFLRLLSIAKAGSSTPARASREHLPAAGAGCPTRRYCRDTLFQLLASNLMLLIEYPSVLENIMSVGTIEELFVDELKDLYSAEKQITKSLPKLAKAATDPELKNAFESHLKETFGQIERLDRVFEILGKSPRGKVCNGMKGVLEEGAEVLEETEKGSPVRDAALISAAQRVEHYEMAGYGCVREYAELLGQEEIAKLLDETLSEEKAADEKLGKVAKQVNPAALQEAA
jgi:ferritin-like metal-binding protein YciE